MRLLNLEHIRNNLRRIAVNILSHLPAPVGRRRLSRRLQGNSRLIENLGGEFRLGSVIHVVAQCRLTIGSSRNLLRRRTRRLLESPIPRATTDNGGLGHPQYVAVVLRTSTRWSNSDGRSRVNKSHPGMKIRKRLISQPARKLAADRRTLFIGQTGRMHDGRLVSQMLPDGSIVLRNLIHLVEKLDGEFRLGSVIQVVAQRRTVGRPTLLASTRLRRMGTAQLLVLCAQTTTDAVEDTTRVKTLRRRQRPLHAQRHGHERRVSTDVRHRSGDRRLGLVNQMENTNRLWQGDLLENDFAVENTTVLGKLDFLKRNQLRFGNGTAVETPIHQVAVQMDVVRSERLDVLVDLRMMQLRVPLRLRRTTPVLFNVTNHLGIRSAEKKVLAVMLDVLGRAQHDTMSLAHTPVASHLELLGELLLTRLAQVRRDRSHDVRVAGDNRRTPLLQLVTVIVRPCTEPRLRTPRTGRVVLVLPIESIRQVLRSDVHVGTTQRVTILFPNPNGEAELLQLVALVLIRQSASHQNHLLDQENEKGLHMAHRPKALDRKVAPRTAKPQAARECPDTGRPRCQPVPEH